MVLEVLTDAAQHVMHRNADAAEMIGIADAGQLQNVGRSNRAGGQDDFC